MKHFFLTSFLSFFIYLIVFYFSWNYILLIGFLKTFFFICFDFFLTVIVIVMKLLSQVFM